MTGRSYAASIVLSLLASPLLAAPPTAQQALELNPIQKDADYDRPTGKETEGCKIKAEEANGSVGWTVLSAEGQVLRRFIDTNGDNKVDQWRYFQSGIEVYRDIDANFNGKADQYRWLGTAGLRWGLDDNEDGQIDRWKMISAEEVTAEVVDGLRQRDMTRIVRLLPAEAEIDGLGLGAELTKEIKERVQATQRSVEQVVQRQKVVGKKGAWVNFGGSRPSVIASGTQGSTADIVLYTDVVVIVDNDGKHGQLPLGTLIRSGEAWRLLDVPGAAANEQATNQAASIFYRVAHSAANSPDSAETSGISPQMQELVAKLEKLDKQVTSGAPSNELAEVHRQRAEVLQALAEASDERDVWWKQLADTVSAAVQSGDFPDGADQLKKLHDQLLEKKVADPVLSYVKYRLLLSEYSVKMRASDADYAKVQEWWQKELEQFVTDHGKSEDAPEAMLQLAIGKEFLGQDDDAVKWYERIAAEFPSTVMAKKANGARRRIKSVGSPLELSGNTIDGKRVNLGAQRGKWMVIHFWATWCEPCKRDIDAMMPLASTYKDKFTPIGVCLDNDIETARTFLKSQRLAWPQIFSEGGLESAVAQELGIFTLPIMILIDDQGKVVDRNIPMQELAEQLKKHLDKK